MKARKVAMLLVVLFTTAGSFFAQLPYEKILNLSDTELKEKKFKYDKNKNRYTMSKSNGLNSTINVLSAIGGQGADIKPHADDYTITDQKGAGVETAYLAVLFHNDDTYHTISEWIAENAENVVETNSKKKTVVKFNYEDKLGELIMETVSVKAVTGNTSAAAKSIDESYNIYNYVIYTGIEPESKWHTKEMEKKIKNKLKGKKEDINDMM